MAQERRNYERFSLTINARRIDERDAETEINILELSIGGCFVEWFDEARLGDDFRLQIPLPEGGWLPVQCTVIYRFTNQGIGVKFAGITRFEQEIIAGVILFHSSKQNSAVDPFAQPGGLRLESPEAERRGVDASAVNFA